VTPHITEFEGGRALSAFRVQQLLPALQAVHDKVTGLSARFVHFGAWDQAPSRPPTASAWPPC
jgi:phosphoribosylformylglycinamidine synthase